ncbi:MAG TPA: hypothetical protein VEM35_04330, partial [Rhizomicrobium sp.]|nr:hypothetical protein [Rhizomicrobium sp.]
HEGGHGLPHTDDGRQHAAGILDHQFCGGALQIGFRIFSARQEPMGMNGGILLLSHHSQWQ